MTMKDKWNARYLAAGGERKACRVLADNSHLLPESGRALELACGHGGNALALAQRGLDVDAMDISDVVIGQLQDFADREQLPIKAIVHDIEQDPPDIADYDVIVMSYFLYRPLFKHIVDGLKEGALIYYQTFCGEPIAGRGPQNPQYRLGRQELLQQFAGLDTLFYREDGTVGLAHGIADEAMGVWCKS